MPNYCDSCEKRIKKTDDSEKKKCQRCKKSFTLHAECVRSGLFVCVNCKSKAGGLVKRIWRLTLFCVLLLLASYAPYKLFHLTRTQEFIEPNILVRIALSWVVSTALLFTLRCCMFGVQLGPGYIYRFVYGDE